MGALVFKETEVYSEEDSSSPKVSFSFDTFVGLGPMMSIVEHRGVLSIENARATLWKLHRQNLIWSWLGGFLGVFPIISYFNYKKQVRLLEQQMTQGVTAPLPEGETPAERQAALLAFVGIILALFAILIIWRLVDPAGLARIANDLKRD